MESCQGGLMVPATDANSWVAHSDWSWWLDGVLSWWLNGVLSRWRNGVHRPTRLPGWGTRIGHGGLMESCHGGSMGMVAKWSPSTDTITWLGHSDWSWWLDGVSSWWLNRALSWWLNEMHRPTGLPGWGTRIDHGGLMESCDGGLLESCHGGLMESIDRHDYLAGALGLVMVA